MSSVSSMWSNFTLTSSNSKNEKRKAAEMEDLRYLYSAFTKIPCLKLAFDHRIPRIADYEEFPFDTAVPLHTFKNISTLEIIDLDFRTIYGWDRLADHVRQLTVKRASLEDVFDLLINIVLDDADGRRKRSAKTSASNLAANPIPRISPVDNSDVARSSSLPDSPSAETRTGGNGRPVSADMSLANYTVGRPALGRLNSVSPPRPSSSRRGSAYNSGRPNGKVRQSSGSSTSSLQQYPTRTHSSNVSIFDRQQSKWRQLRYLSLADNALTSISRQSLLPLTSTLQSLDLSSNLFSEIPDSLASLVALRSLNLGNCMIESLHTLARSPLPAITVLNLRGNRIASLAGIEKLLSLERLDVRENKLRDPMEVARLTNMPNFRDVWVQRNPFTKTHNNYRLAIFNLFRNAPGYEEDVSVDGAGPSYSERRQFIDRAPEPVNVPVIKPPVDDDSTSGQTDITLTSKNTSYTSESADDIPRAALGALSNDASSQTQRRKKGPKRRIVDLTQTTEDSKPTLTSYNSSTTPQTASQRYASHSHTDPLSPILSPIPSLTDDAQTPSVEHPWPDNQQADHEQYRKRLESLKTSYGNGWLSALGDDGWQESHATLSPTSYGVSEKDVPSAMSVNPAMSATAVSVKSSGRRLG